MLRRMDLLGILVVAALFITGCAGEEDKIEIKEGIAARIGDESISELEIEERLESLPYNQKKKFEGMAGRANLVDELIKEKMMYMEALDKKLQYDKDVKERLEFARKSILIGAYYQHISENIKIDDKEIQDYYQDNQLEFRTDPVIRAQHIFSRDSMKAVRWKEKIEKSSDPEIFNRLAKKESEDSTTAMDLGDLGYFNPHGFIKFIGKDKEFGNAVEWLEVGQVSDVLRHRKGYSIVKVKEKEPAIITPLSDVNKDIEKKLQGRKIDEAVVEEIERLKEKYEPKNYLREKLLENTRTASELWELATEESSPKNKIIYYRAITTSYPDDELAAQALFMIGFTYAEEMGDLSFARRAFNELLRKYPDAEIAESARWMLDNLGKKALKFDSVEEMEEEMKKE